MTGIEGDFRIPYVPAGTHEVESSTIGYNTVTVTEAVVAVGEVLRLDLVLTSEANRRRRGGRRGPPCATPKHPCSRSVRKPRR